MVEEVEVELEEVVEVEEKERVDDVEEVDEDEEGGVIVQFPSTGTRLVMFTLGPNAIVPSIVEAEHSPII